jgi:hypothetical protein
LKHKINRPKHVSKEIKRKTACAFYTFNTRNNNNNNNNNNKINTGTSDMGTINSSDRIAATLYSLGTLFVSGIYA